MKIALSAFAALALTAAVPSFAPTEGRSFEGPFVARAEGPSGGGQDKSALKTALKDTEPQGDWIYDDLNAGYATAKKAGKPMLVVFR